MACPAIRCSRIFNLIPVGNRFQVALLASVCYFSRQENNSVRAFSVSKPFASKYSSNPQDMTSSSMNPDFLSKNPSHAWCCTASVDPSNQSAKIKEVAGDSKNTEDSPFQTIGGTTYDITASPDWMEIIEISEKRENDEGGAGAYDTMRCDLIVKQPTASVLREHWIIWGEYYHLQRLENSFHSLLKASSHQLSEAAIQKAKQESDVLIRALMKEAESSSFLREKGRAVPEEDDKHGHTSIQLVKLTLLWSLPKDNAKLNAGASEIAVRGHACSSSNPLPVFRSVQPIVVTVAALRHSHEGAHTRHHSDDDAVIDTSLPTRFQNPQSKVASWCKQRKKMDNPKTYKPPGVSEVLMVRPNSKLGPTPSLGTDTHFSSLELLEGLSSNVFVIYKDGTLRTAREGVLYGYVRHLVLQSAEKCGLTVDTNKPISLQDAVDDNWSEVFITSSSRLIWPVSRILLPSGEEPHNGMKQCEIDGFSEFWSDTVLTNTGVISKTPRWQDILDDILRNEGYAR